ncbi:MAG: flagellar basal body-associated FliL family protein [Methylovulum sp.]|nr:flagellar basal body-associated FliL family protein [Methylovulum sp.]
MAEHEQEQGGGGVRLSSKKLIILIVAGVLLLAAGGAGTFFLMKGQMAQPEEASHEKHENVSLYYDMSKAFVVDFPKGGPIELVQLAVTFVVEDQGTADALKKNEPMLRNNLLMIISSQSPDKLNTTEGKEALRKAMLDDVAATLKKLSVHGEVKEVLFTSFIMQ